MILLVILNLQLAIFQEVTLKIVKLKYQQVVDSGRRSGHGRVVLLYFELCEKVWGGSPATKQLNLRI